MKSSLLFMLLLSSVLLITIRCNGNSGKVQEIKESNPDMPQEKVVDRIAEVQKCAKCHQAEYKSWMKGPHSNAYKMLIEHVDHVESSDGFSENYKAFIPKMYKDVCLSCHTGQNVYETVLSGLDSEQDIKKCTEEYYPDIQSTALARNKSDLKNLSTGVDCMTCHASGSKNVASNKSSSSGQKGSCELIKSPFFSSNQNCFSCHHHQVRTMQRLVEEKKLNSEADCVTCHQQYDEENKGTHYFYWRQDSSDIVRPDRLNIFSKITSEIVKSGSETSLNTEWANTFLPHDFSECGEVVLIIEILSSNGEILKTGSLRLNRRDFMKDQGAPHFLEGVSGNQFIYKGSSAISSIKLVNANKVKSVRLRGLVKPQYWSQDTELEEVYSKTIRL